MRRTVLVVPGLVSEPGTESFLRGSLPGFARFSEIGTLRKVARLPESETPEAMVLGMGPQVVRLRQGPLTVSALGFDPPERSTHFHLSLMSFADGVASFAVPRPGEVEAVVAELARLNTKSLTLLRGELLDHGLVWEALGDLGTTSATQVEGKEMHSFLPEGDGEAGLRRLIDDSVNLLSSLEMNERRMDEGLPPINLLWPWGHGVRTATPNLALLRGAPAVVESGSMRLQGLTRLVGYRHGDRGVFGRGLNTKLRSIASRAVSRELTIVFIDAAAELREKEMPEELDWFIRQMDSELIQPLLQDMEKGVSRVVLVSPGEASVGLALSADSGSRAGGAYPFDERSLEEKSVPAADLWTLVAAGLSD